MSTSTSGTGEHTEPAATPSPDDAASRAPAADLVGLLALGGLARFTRLADDAARTPDVPWRLRLSRMAAAELTHIDVLAGQAAELGGDLEAAMASFVDPLREFDARTAPSDRWEGLMTTYIGHGVLADLERELVGGLDSRPGIADVLGDTGAGDLVVEVLEPVLADDSVLSSRMALWGRIVVGEALGFAQAVLASHPSLATLLGAADEEGAVTRLLSRLAGGHARRMDRLGLTA